MVHETARKGTLCRPCESSRQRAHYELNRAKAAARQTARYVADPDFHHAKRLKRYGLDADSYAHLMERQGGRCAICRSDESGVAGRRFCVDHDHNCCPAGTKACGRCVRGLLCWHCNIGIGKLGDSPELLRAAAQYLEEKNHASA